MRTATVFFPVVAILASFAPFPATAQNHPAAPLESRTPPASDRRNDSYNFSREESDREFAAYSNCIIGSVSGQRDAAAFLRLVPNNAAWGEAGRKLTSPECLRSSFGRLKLRYNLTALRPALFAAMYRRQFGKTPPTSFADEPALALDKLYDGSTDGFPQQTLAQLNFGNCVARADSSAVHRLLMARPWSDAEDAALPAITKVMGGCLPTNQTLRLSRSSARGVLAEAMYQLASARPAGTTVADASATKVR